MSSTYRPICLSHSPALVLDIELTYDEARTLDNRTRISDHQHCDIIIGRWSGALVELACLGRQLPGPTGCKGYHCSPDWTDRDWLRLLLAAAPSIDADWSAGHLHRHMDHRNPRQDPLRSTRRPLRQRPRQQAPRLPAEHRRSERVLRVDRQRPRHHPARHRLEGLTMPFPDIHGHCPACGWTTLFLGDGGYPTCSRIDCPEPDAASKLLERDPRTAARDAIDALPREQLHHAIRVMSRIDPKWWRDELTRMARMEGRTSLLGRH